VCANPPVNGLDQRGYARPGSGHTQCSIGAYEADAFSPEACTGDCGGTGSVTVDELITLVSIAPGQRRGVGVPAWRSERHRRRRRPDYPGGERRANRMRRMKRERRRGAPIPVRGRAVAGWLTASVRRSVNLTAHGEQRRGLEDPTASRSQH
jgi:hypothetical protein